MSRIAIESLSSKALPNEIAFAGERHWDLDAASMEGMLVGLPANPDLWTLGKHNRHGGFH